MAGDYVGEVHVPVHQLHARHLVEQGFDHASLAGHPVPVRGAGPGPHVAEGGEAVEVVVTGFDGDEDGWAVGQDGLDPLVDRLAHLQVDPAEQVDDFDETHHVEQHVVLDGQAGQLGEGGLDGVPGRIIDLGEGFGVPQPEAVDLVDDLRIPVRPSLRGGGSVREGDVTPVAGHAECRRVAGGHIDRDDDDGVGPDPGPVEPGVAAQQGDGEAVGAVPCQLLRCGQSRGGGSGWRGRRLRNRCGGFGCVVPDELYHRLCHGGRGDGGGKRGRGRGQRVGGDEYVRQQGQLHRCEADDDNMGCGDERGHQGERDGCPDPSPRLVAPPPVAAVRNPVRVHRDS